MELHTAATKHITITQWHPSDSESEPGQDSPITSHYCILCLSFKIFGHRKLHQILHQPVLLQAKGLLGKCSIVFRSTMVNLVKVNGGATWCTMLQQPFGAEQDKSTDLLQIPLLLLPHVRTISKVRIPDFHVASCLWMILVLFHCSSCCHHFPIIFPSFFLMFPTFSHNLS